MHPRSIWSGVTGMVATVSTYAGCYGRFRGPVLYLARTVWPALDGRPVAAAPRDGRRLLVRLGSTDLLVFHHIFRERQYAWSTPHQPGLVVDAGAYTGLSTAFFAAHYPGAHIIALEPDRENFGLLLRNTAGLRNVTAVNAALWPRDTAGLVLTDPGYGAWGLRVAEGAGAPATTTSATTTSAPTTSATAPATTSAPAATATDAATDADAGPGVRAVTVDSLLAEHGADRIGLLKLDIEGAEKAVLTASDSWIDRVDAMCVELHDRFQPGCTRAFYGAARDFPVEEHRDEMIFVAREPASAS